MPRTQVGTLGTPRIQPVASPVDSFTAPNAGSKMREIATALQNLSPALNRLAAQQIDAEKERGRNDATAIYEDVKATRDKIKTGEIAPHESRWYRAAAKEQVGRLMAAAYGQDLLLATQSDEALKDSTDPADFDEFEAQTRKRWMDEHADGEDPAFMAGFNAVSAQSIMNARQSFVSGAAQRLDGQVLDNTYTEHQLAIREALERGEGVEQIAANIAQRNAALYTANPKLGAGTAGRSLTKTTIEAVFDAARAYEDPELLKILDHIPGGVKGSTIGMTREALSQRDNVEREIRVNRQGRLSAEEKDEKRKRNVEVDTIYDGVLAALEENPETDVSPFATKMMNVDRAEVPKLYRMAKAFATAANRDDEGVAGDLYERAFENDLTFGEVADAFSEGLITVKTAKDLRAQIRGNRVGSGRSRGAKALIQDPVFAAFARDLDDMWVKHMGDVPGSRGVYSRQQLRREWVAFMQSEQGAAATEQEKLDWLQGTVTRVFLRFADAEVSEIRDLALSSPKPDKPKPKPGKPDQPDWRTEEVAPWRGWDLDGFAREWKDIQRGARSKFSPAALSIVQRYELAGRDIDAFIAAQRQARKAQR